MDEVPDVILRDPWLMTGLYEQGGKPVFNATDRQAKQAARRL